MNAETVNVKFADSLKSWNKGERLEVPLVLSRESREQIALFGLEPFIDQCRQSLEGMLGLKGFQLAPCGGRGPRGEKRLSFRLGEREGYVLLSPLEG